MDNCRPDSTPIDPKTSLGKESDADPVFEQNLYQCMIGSLMCLVTCTRPYLASSVSYLSGFWSHPLRSHHTAVKRVFRYLAGTRCMFLKYKRSTTSVALSIVAFSDSDYASCCDTHRPYILMRLCYMVVLYPDSLRNSTPLPLLQRKQNTWLLRPYPVKQSGASTHSHNSVTLYPWRLWNIIPLTSTLLRMLSTILNLRTSTLLHISQEKIVSASALRLLMYHLTIKLPTSWLKDWTLLLIIDILNISGYHNGREYCCIHSVPL